MSKRKSIAVAIVLLLILLIGGMIAFFTDNDTRTNVFTLGKDVNITLTENSDWEQDTTGSGNNYTYSEANAIHPGKNVAKAPQINNISTDTPAYVFAEVIVPCYSPNATGDATTPLFNLIDSNGNVLNTTVGSSGNSGWTLTAMTTLAKASSAETPTSTVPVFNSVTLKNTITGAEAATASTTPNIVVNAYGIQIDNLGATAPLEIFALFNANP